MLNVLGGGVHSAVKTYDEEHINTRSRLIPYAVNARKKRFPNEKPFLYKPLINSGKKYIWDENSKLDIKDYNLLDMSI